MIAAFIAACASGPVNALSRHMKRGAAIGIVYVAILVAPAVIFIALVRPFVEQGVSLVNNLPEYVQDLDDQIQKNDQLKKIDDDYDLTGKLDELSKKLVNRSATRPVRSWTSARASSSSLFVGVTVLVMSMFMVRAASCGATPSCDYDHPARRRRGGVRVTASPTRWPPMSEARCSRRLSRASPRGSCW